MQHFVNFVFMDKQENLSPVDKPVLVLNNIKAADITAIGAMKIELILRRAVFRDYYDIFAILNEGIHLKTLISKGTQYSRHILKTRDILNFLSNASNYKKEREFSLLDPFYHVKPKDIEAYMKETIKREYT